MNAVACLTATVLLAALCQGAFAAETQPQSQPLSTNNSPTANQEEKSFSRAITHTYTGDYLLYLPKGLSEKGQEPAKRLSEISSKMPLVLFLHGSATRNDPRGEEVTLHGLPMLIAQGKEFPFIVVSPKCAAGKWWNADNLSALLEEICEKYPVDIDRIYLTGLSMGGFAAWDLAAKFPYRFAAIAPVCGGGEPKDAPKIKHLPIWAFHGAKDGVVPVKRTLEMIEAVKAAGGEPKATIYPETDHDSWNEAYATDELYTWMLSHTLWIPPLKVEAEPYVAGKPAKVTLESVRERPISASIAVAGVAEPIKATVTQDGQTLELPVPAGATGPVELTMTLDGRQEQKLWLVPAAIQVPRLGDIKLDGKLDDWLFQKDASSLGEHALVSSTTKDFLPELRMGWTSEGLYLAVRMQANDNADATPQTFWRGPNMEVFLDSAGVAGKGWPKTSLQFVAVPGKDGETWKTTIVEWKRSDAIAETNFDDTRCKSATDVTDGVMTIEWFIPAEALGAAPAAGAAWRAGLTLTASIPHRPERYGAWPISKDSGLLDGVEKLGEVRFVEGK